MARKKDPDNATVRRLSAGKSKAGDKMTPAARANMKRQEGKAKVRVARAVGSHQALVAKHAAATAKSIAQVRAGTKSSRDHTAMVRDQQRAQSSSVGRIAVAARLSTSREG